MAVFGLPFRSPGLASRLSLRQLTSHFLLLLLFLLIVVCSHVFGSHQGLEVVYAINAGGEAHIDSHGIEYERDPLMGREGVASDYGKRLAIKRVPQQDQILYQTERYHHSTFDYDIPLVEDGDYVMILKFSEVYFNAPNMKVFDVVLNGDHSVVTDLDIFEEAGLGVAHDEYVPFSVKDGKLIYETQQSEILGGKIKVEFIKGYRDNPKINAIVVIKGTLIDVPKLDPLPQEPKEYISPHKAEEEPAARTRQTSGPRTPDPYASDESSLLLPIIIAIGAFIPVLFCLCKL